MKLPEKLNPSKLLRKDRKGVALVTVLTVMALTTILVLTFFSLATSEHRASNTYSHGLQAQQVAEQAVNMVIAQIREATAVGTTRGWASQPGAIRVWGDDYEDTQDRLAYKLYSDDVLKTKDWNEFDNDFTDLNNWAGRPDHYVDLNEPVIRDQKVYYPIVHPLASTVPKWPKKIGDETDDEGVEGFSYNENGDIVAGGGVGDKAAKIIKQEHLAMPVKWIYQLADGTLGTLDDGGGSGSNAEYQFVALGNGAASTPSAVNPIVARFAFWTDDETTKLNINTHAGGLAWDTPKAGGALDMDMGKHQPAQKEWQRYPGHPASTHLSPVMAPGVLDIVNDRDAMEMLYNVVPRVVGGGSESGTRVLDTRRPEEANGLVADSEPLFPTLDDVIMRSDREPHEFPDAQGTKIPKDELSEYLERSKFFMTVSSRAPETTLFNTPRIAIWPISNAAYGTADYEKRLTTFDRLIHFCSSMGKSGGGYPRWEYIFKREKADSATWDYKDIPRNEQLYRYFRNMLSEKVPGYDKSFVDKYGSDNVAQMATMIFDYIRTTNLHDDTLYPDFQEAFTQNNSNNHVTYTNPRDKSEPGFGHKGHGQVTPISIDMGGESNGIGRFFTLAGAHVHVTCVGQPGISGALYPGMTQYNRGQVEAPSGDLYTNLPPLPVGVTKENEGSHPAWLSALKVSDPLEYNAAFEPANWNWQLAFLDPGYRDAVLAEPTAKKYNRGLITAANSAAMRLGLNERLMQAAFMFNLFSPSIGWGSINPDMEIEISASNGMTFQSTGDDPSVGFLGFENNQPYIWATNWSKPHKQGGARSWGGLLSFGYTISARQPLQEGSNLSRNVWWQLQKNGVYGGVGSGVRARLTPIDRGYDKIQDVFSNLGRDFAGSVGNTAENIARAYRYDLVTVPFKVNVANLAALTPGAGSDIDFTGGEVNFKIYDKGVHTEASSPDSTERNLVQDVTLEIDDFQFGAPRISLGWQGYVNEFTALSSDSSNALEIASLTAEAANPIATVATKSSMRTGVGSGRGKSSASNYGRLSLLASHWDSSSTYVRPGDIVQAYSIAHGDARLVAAKKVIGAGDGYFDHHPDYGSKAMAHSLVTSSGVAVEGFNSKLATKHLIIPDLPGPDDPYRGAIPLPFYEESSNVQLYGDFDNGAGTMIDGPYINKPDEGNVHALQTKFQQGVNDIWESRRNRGDFPYFTSPDLAEAGGPAYFSPNRIVSGPGMFGSIPTGVMSNDPWQTLLFRPNVVGERFDSHPGAESPPDHVIMDMFWMPVVEPYAISEPLSTGGKVNLNYQIVPFLHVTRNTALRGVFRSELMLCVPNQWHHSYKHDYGRGKGYHWRDAPYSGAVQLKRLRTAIVEHTTLEQFDEKFDRGREVFKSSSEICDIHLIPVEVSTRMNSPKGSIGSYTPSVTQMQNGQYWDEHALVGDNSRERPYTNIQTRVTTKSNSYLVHYRAQVLQQSRRESDAEYGVWRPSTDSVQAEYRGSSGVERHVDPNSTVVPDYAVLFGTAEMEDLPIDKFYQYRVVNPKRFAP